MRKKLLPALAMALAAASLASAEIVANLGLGLPGIASGATAEIITVGPGGTSATTNAMIIPRGACLDANLEIGHAMISEKTVFGLGFDYKTLGSAMLRFNDRFAIGATDLATAYTYLRLDLNSWIRASIRGGLAGYLEGGPGPYLGCYLELGNVCGGADIALLDIRSAEGLPQPAGEKYDFASYAGYSLFYRLRLGAPKGGEKPYFASSSRSAANAAIVGYGLGVPLAFAGTFLYLIFAR